MRALGLDHRRDGNVVTNGLHFEGALMHLRRASAPSSVVRWVESRLRGLIDGAV